MLGVTVHNFYSTVKPDFGMVNNRNVFNVSAKRTYFCIKDLI